MSLQVGSVIAYQKRTIFYNHHGSQEREGHHYQEGMPPRRADRPDEQLVGILILAGNLGIQHIAVSGHSSNKTDKLRFRMKVLFNLIPSKDEE